MVRKKLKGSATLKRRHKSPEKTREKPFDEIGKLVRNLRISKGYSQFDLAELLGVNNSYLSRIENGERRPSTKIMRKMGEALDFPYDELVVASGLLSPEFRERQALQSDKGVLRDIREIRTALARLVPPLTTLTPGSPRAAHRRAIPLFDRVPAGLLDEANVVQAYDDIEKIVLAEDELNYDPKAFALVVKGDSMVEAGILDGDVLVVSPSSNVEDGDIAVVQVNRRETTVKIVYYQGDYLLLQPANCRYKAMLLKYPDEVEILGKVILVRRKFIA